MEKETPQEALHRRIDAYMSVMPVAHTFNICRQKETKKILRYSIRKLRGIDTRHHLLPELNHSLRHILKWDGVTREPQDVQFKLILDKVKKDLKALKKSL